MEFGQDADAVGAVRRKLIDIVAGIVVALDQQRPVIGHAHVPAYNADLRHDLACALYKRDDLVPKRDLEALNGHAGQGMHVVQMPGLIQRRVDYLAPVLLYGHDHAAVIEVIDILAVADAQVRGYDARFFAVGEAYDAAGVDRAGVQRHEVAMLHDALLQQHLACAVQVLTHRLGQLAHVELLNAAAALPVNGLHHEHGVLFDKCVKLGVARCGVVEPVAVQKLGEVVREFELILDLGHIRRVVIRLDEAVIYASREHRFALRGVEVVHLEQPIVHISGLVAQSAPDHVEKYEQLAASGLLVDLVYLPEHLLPVQPRYARKQKF